MKNFRNLLFVSLFFFMLTLGTLPASAEGTDSTKPLETNADGAHEVRIESRQWVFVAFDMVQVNRLVDEGMSLADAKLEAEYHHRVGSFKKGGHVILSVVSSDVQHGFSLTMDDVEVQLATVRPEPGQEFGTPTTVEFDVPNTDGSYSAFCHIFCGLGHPDMKMKFIVGGGATEYGRIIYYSVIAINILVAALTGWSLWKKFSVAKETTPVTA